MLPVGVAWRGVAFALLAYSLVCLWRSGACCCCFMVWAYSRPQAVAWPAVFSCGLGVHLCTCSVFYSSSAFLASLVYRVLLGFSPPPFPPGSVSFLCFGSGLGLGFVLCFIQLFRQRLSKKSVRDNAKR